MPVGGLVFQLYGATQLTPTNLLTMATWVRPTGFPVPGLPMPSCQWPQGPVRLTGWPKQAAIWEK